MDMLRVISLSALLCLATVAAAESVAVDDVLKKGTTVSEEQLDATAETLLAQQEADQKTAVAKPAAAAAKTLSESQIPAFHEQKSVKASDSSAWMRLIGSGIFMILVTVVLFIAVKKMGKRKNIIGKKAKIDIIHQHFLGPKKSIALVQVAGETILIGITDHNINMIKSVALIDDEVEGQPQDFHGFLDEEEFTVGRTVAELAADVPTKRTKARFI
jgi:flagellar biogenesis protein FliO